MLVRLSQVCSKQEEREEEEGAENDKMPVYGFTSSRTVSFESGVRVFTDLRRREQCMNVLHEAMNVVV